MVLLTACVEEVPIDESDRCPGCAVELERIATLEFANASSSPTPMFSRLEQLPDSSFLLSTEKGTATLMHFAADGSYLGDRARAGEGPGEISDIGAIALDGDSVWLVDPSRGRCNVYDASSLRDGSRGLDYGRSFRCFELQASDLASVGGHLFVTGFGPLGLVEIDMTEGERRQVRGSDDTLPTGEYASLAAGSEGAWYVPHPHEYRVEYWLPGQDRPERVLERSPVWWKPIEQFDLRDPNAPPDAPPWPEDRQTLAGPVLWNIGVHDGFVWTASYILTRPKNYGAFLEDWVQLGLQGDTRVHLEALTTRGELVASDSFGGMAPPRFTSTGLLYTTERDGLDVQIAVYRPRVGPERVGTASSPE